MAALLCKFPICEMNKGLSYIICGVDHKTEIHTEPFFLFAKMKNDWISDSLILWPIIPLLRVHIVVYFYWTHETAWMGCLPKVRYKKYYILYVGIKK